MNTIKEEVKNNLQKKYGFITQNSVMFSSVIFKSNTSDNYKETYDKALKNIEEYIIKRINNNELFSLMVNCLEFSNADYTFDLFNKIVDKMNYEVSDEEINELSDHDGFSYYYKKIIKSHKSEVDNLDFSFLKNNILKRVLEIYSLSLVEDILEDINSYKIDDSIKQYLREISNYPLLSIQEERELSIKSKNGDKEARNSLVERNLRLVVSIAKKYNRNNMELALLDIIQDGNVGLIKAAERFDVDMGYRFSTYATWWIKQSILRGIREKGRAIRIPIAKQEKINKLSNFESQYISEFSKEPTVEELARYSGYRIEEVKEIKQISQSILSIDKNVGEDEDSIFGDFVADQSAEETIYEEAERKDKAALIEEVKNIVTPREFKVLDLRLGLTDDKQRTLENSGEILGISRERVRQIEQKAITKAKRHHGVIYKKNKTYFENKQKLQTVFKDENDLISQDRIKKITNRIKSKSNDQLDVISFDHSITNVTVICNECKSSWTQRISDLLIKCYCPSCKMNTKRQKYENKIKELNKDIEIGEFEKASEHVLIRCTRCHDNWYAVLTTFISNGARCINCEKLNRHFVKNMKSYTNKVNEIMNYEFDYDYRSLKSYKKVNSLYDYENKIHEDINKTDEELIFNNLDLEIFKSTFFTKEQIIVLLLSYGYINGNEYSDEAIAKYLHVDIKFVKYLKEYIKEKTMDRFPQINIKRMRKRSK